MFSVQLGSALSTHLFDALSPAGTIWLRLVLAAVVLLAITRPAVRSMKRPVLLGTLALGATTGLLMLMFIEAIARIPLGTASAIEFLGPLTVAAIRSHRRLALIWPATAMVGVVVLTQPWSGRLDVPGILFAAGAAVGWAGYILLTQRVGAQVQGLQGLAISFGTAALVATPFGAVAAIEGMTPMIVLQGLGLAVLLPLLPFILELFALRRMSLAAFGTLMAVEPGIATALGLVVLSQSPSLWQLLGIALVVVAGVGAQRDPGELAVPAGEPPQGVPAVMVDGTGGPLR